jgi:hypothetical protein
MAAFLTVDVLRAHGAPVFPRVPFWHASEPVRPSPAPWPRPMLTVRWLIAPDGRLTCRWQADVSAPFGPPPN